MRWAVTFDVASASWNVFFIEKFPEQIVCGYKIPFLFT